LRGIGEPGVPPKYFVTENGKEPNYPKGRRGGVPPILFSEK